MGDNTELEFAEMDDDQFESAMQDSSSFEKSESEEQEQETSEEESDESTEDSETGSEEDSQEELDQSGEDDLDSTEDDSTESEGEDDGDKTEGETEEESSEEEAETEETDTSEPNLEELFKPFKASGKDVSVKSIEEARKLMSMGVDYSVKLQGFKQHKGTIKTLQQNEIGSDELNYLIDLKNGNADAINKLLRDHKVDPLELEVEEDSSYKPSDHSVSQSQVDLDDVLERIQSSESFSTTTDIVTNQWDDTSRQAVFKKPELLELINEHVSNGTYKRVNDEVQRARMFGGLNGLSDLEAYDKVGSELFKADKEKPAPTKTVSTSPKTKANTDRKRKASPTKNSKSSSNVKENFADMGDEEFEKYL